MSEEKNVILLVIDALRKDHMSCYGYERETTPFLDKFAEENTKIENCWSTSSHTREAVPSLMTGKYPHESINQKYELVGENIAQKLEHNSAAFHSNPFISRAYGYDKGFDRFHDGLNRGRNKIITLGKRLLDKILNRHYERAEKINKLSLDWIESQDGNQYMDVHGPYEPVEEFRGSFQDEPIGNRKSQLLLQKARKKPGDISENERQRLVDLYDEEILYTDRKIQEFIDELKEREIYEDSIVIITSDHGEAFGEDGFYEHPRRLSDGLLKVPMLIKSLDIEEDSVMSLKDIFNLFTRETDGRRFKVDETVFAQVTEKRSDFNFYGAMNGEESNYVHSKPGECNDIQGPLSRELREFIENIEKRSKSENVDKKDEEIKEKLEALGYGD